MNSDKIKELIIGMAFGVSWTAVMYFIHPVLGILFAIQLAIITIIWFLSEPKKEIGDVL